MAKIYLTKDGDAWDEVSKELYGSELFMHEVMKANPQYRDYVLLPGGLTLTIPEIDTRTFPTVTPSWKRAYRHGR